MRVAVCEIARKRWGSYKVSGFPKHQAPSSPKALCNVVAGSKNLEL